VVKKKSGRILLPHIELQKIDNEGRIVLPVDWRESELKNTDEVVIFRGSGYLKIFSKQSLDLTQFFDKADFGENVELSSDWNQLHNDLVKKSLKQDFLL